MSSDIVSSLREGSEVLAQHGLFWGIAEILRDQEGIVIVGRIPDGSSQPAVRVNGWIGTLIVGNVFRNAKVRAPEEQDWVTRAQTREGDITTTEVKAVAQAARSELSAVSTK